METIRVGIGVVSQRIRAVLIHLFAILQSIIIGIRIFVVGAVQVVFRPVFEAVIVAVGEVVALIDEIIAIIVDSVQPLPLTRIDLRVAVIAVLEMVEQVTVIVHIVDQWVASPVIDLDSVGQSVVVAVPVEGIGSVG